jgi:hypothetical protein
MSKNNIHEGCSSFKVVKKKPFCMRCFEEITELKVCLCNDNKKREEETQ